MFPYASAFFGVVDYSNARGRAKLIVVLIKLFPLVSVVALYLAWTSMSYLALVPFVHFGLVYSIRENKNLADGPTKQFKTETDNLESIMTTVEISWQQWLEEKASKNLLLVTFFAENTTLASTLIQKIKSSDLALLDDSSNSFKNGSKLCDVEFAINSFERNPIEDLIKKLVRLAWESDCELKHLDVFPME